MDNKIERVKTSLQLQEDIDLHITGWILQRVGWVLMLIFLISAALGAFGDGLLSDETISTSSVTVIYQRFYRNETTTELEIRTSAASRQLVVQLPADFSRIFEIERINPEPAEQKINNGFIEHIFDVTGAGEVTYHIKSLKWGRRDSRIRINDEDFNLKFLIYP